jgi:hypothetical protein
MDIYIHDSDTYHAKQTNPALVLQSALIHNVIYRVREKIRTGRDVFNPNF